MATTMKAGATGQRALLASTGTSLRVKPFTPLVAGRPVGRASVRVRVAEAEVADDFSFSFSDAKKANEYSSSDVEAAIRYYETGEGASPVFDSDFVGNVFGVEDASFFDDIDNETAYADEFIVAGIPEAAPKKRGRGGPRQAAQEEDDDLEQAKALDKVKALEDRMVLEAAMEEEYGAEGGAGNLAVADASKPGVWDWLTDLESAETGLVETSVSSGDATDGAVTADIASATVRTDVFDDPEVQTYLDLFSTDDMTEEVLAALDSAQDGAAVPNSSITDEELSRLDALVDEQIPVLELTRVEDANVPRLGDSPELEKAVVDQYIASLRAVVASGARATQDEVKALFGDEPLNVEVAAAEDAAAVAETKALLEAAEPTITGAAPDFSVEMAALQDTTGELAEDDDGGLERELRGLAAIDEITEADFDLDGTANLMESLEGYVVAGEDWVAQEEARKASIAAAVARGELSADVLAEELEEVPDAVDDLLADGAWDEEENIPLDAVFDEDDGEEWMERILELTRVTKVVKGGKIMGFRCVAIVGNQNGLVGVGCQAGREVAVAVKRTLVDAKRNVVKVPLVGAGTVPHRSEAKYHAARCLVLPASDGTGCIAGGSVRSVLELAGVRNCLAKRIGSRSTLNSARATVRALQQMQSLPEVAKARGVPMERLLLPQ